MLTYAVLLLVAAQVDIWFDPPVDSIVATPGTVVRVDLMAGSDSPHEIAAIDSIISWDPTRLSLITVGTGDVTWFAEGFFPEPDGINDDILDGEALYTVLSPPGAPVSVPPDIQVATFHFAVWGTGDVLMPATAGVWAQSRVIGTEPGLVITGDLSDPACLGVEGAWTDLGFGKPGTGGLVPELFGTGKLACDDLTTYWLSDALPGALAYFVLGISTLYLPFKGGILVPTTDIIIPVIVSPVGTVVFGFPWPPGVPPGVSLYYQYWILDPGGFAGFSASNGLQSETS